MCEWGEENEEEEKEDEERVDEDHELWEKDFGEWQ